MQPEHELEHRIREHVQAFLRGELTPGDLGHVDPAIRAEVSARCEEADFVQHFFDGAAPSTPACDRPSVIGGCELLELIGTGAMGEVHRARQVDLDRVVAVKLVRGELAHREDFQARFAREAHVLASLDHPGIVRVLSYGEENGFRFFVMELVVGRDLGTVLPELTAQAEREPARAADRAARIGAELLETLAYAHGRGIAHRDLKPSNVMLDANDHPRLVDFGLAKALEDDGTDWRIRTVPGLLLGTPAYWSPEVAARRPFVQESPDVWAAGVMLFQMLTGELPYGGRSPEELIASLSAPADLDPRQLAPRVPTPLAAIAHKALAPDPGDRYGSAQEFAADLRRFLARQPVAACERRPVQRLSDHLWRCRRRYATTCSALAIGGAIWFGAQAHATAVATTVAVEQLVAGDGVEAMSAAERTTRAHAARRMLADGRLGRAQAAAVTSLLQDLEAWAHREQVEAAAMIARGAGTPRGTPRPAIAAPSLALQVHGVQRASTAALVLGESVAGTELLATGFPRLRVEHPVGGGAVPFRIEAIEPITGQPALALAQGTTPFELELPPGDYRVVAGEANAFAECVRSLGPPGVTVVTPRLQATAALQPGMLRVPSGIAVVGQGGAQAYIYAAQSIGHAAFWIDRDEVTCGAYHAFCQASGAPLPKRWQGVYDPAWHELPVLVSHAEATAFAEWHGKRLPTWTEWQVAARGANGALYPWGDDPAQLPQLATVGGDDRLPWHQGVRAVGATPLDTTWCGARDMLGNIDEWTATCYVASFDGMPFPFYPWRLRAGSHWDAGRGRTTALDVVSPGPPEWFGTGFRCAKSINP